ncbi:MAG: DUF1566 domain-containing protein [Deltaproteobacteria bacterium]|nr:DUF1566 domain-containing protein [Deltaproteobacteria bacterium]
MNKKIVIVLAIAWLAIAATSAGAADNGTVTINGLVWLKNTNCFNYLKWIAAKSAAESLKDGQCNLSDGSQAGQWRLPTMLELKSVFSSRGQFTNVAYPYWSSTLYSTDAFTGYSWYYVVLDEHTVTYNNSVGISHVWPVRNP